MSVLTSNWNATRFAQKPLAQPAYNFAHVPAALPTLQYSSLQYVDERDAFHSCMAEMLLLCKEAQRRRRHGSTAHGGGHAAAGGRGGGRGHAITTASKPLSLEYLADRIDVDDPIFGFVVRTQEKMSSDIDVGGDDENSNWQRGMLQGFITCTTFTNYQRTFQWDSLNPAAFFFDPEEETDESVVRIRDEDGSLAAEMQATVRCGDIWNEGIVWPRIAEISLLGGLKCGKTLVSLVIEHLECMKASGRCNYDYVVLQATDNSISFYESMGFVRVGAVVNEEQDNDMSSNKSGGSTEDDVAAPEKRNGVARDGVDFVGSPTISYTITKGGETVQDVARKANVDVWDTVFLNKHVFPDITPRSRLLAGTVLQIHAPPPKADTKAPAKTQESPQWYIAKEDDTPRMIAKMFNVSCLELVEANKHRLEGLLSNSRLKAGTRVQVSRFDFVPDRGYKPYAHWSFPDDQFEEPEPSYMMARRLERRKGNTSKQRPFESSLAIPITMYEPSSLVLPPSPENVPAVATAPENSLPSESAPATVQASQARRPPPPQPPKRAPSPYLMFASEQRELRRDEFQGMRGADIAKYLSRLWNALPPAARSKYVKESFAMRQEYHRLKAQYVAELEAHKVNNNYSRAAMVPESASTSTYESSSSSSSAPAASSTDLAAPSVPSRVGGSSSNCSLFNMVVKLKPGAMTEGSEYTYWYVLTFIPDLRWCHLAPMVPVGTFGPEKPKSQGRPKYKLVDESLGKEVDISSSFCVPIKSRSTKRTLDADKEEWDIIDDGSDPCSDGADSVAKAPRNLARGESEETPESNPGATQVPTRMTTSDRLPRLSAIFKKREVAVKVTFASGKREGSLTKNPIMTSLGKRKRPPPNFRSSRSHDSASSEFTEDEEPSRKKRGGPKTSKCKPKTAGSQPKTAPHSKASIAASTPVREGEEPVKRGRGRPKGSKNKPKTIDTDVARLSVESNPVPVVRSSVPAASGPAADVPVELEPICLPTKKSRACPSSSSASSLSTAPSACLPHTENAKDQSASSSASPSSNRGCERPTDDSNTASLDETPQGSQSKHKSHLSAGQELIKPFAVGLTPSKRGRGRPRGSKNKPKIPVESSSSPPLLPFHSTRTQESSPSKPKNQGRSSSLKGSKSKPEPPASPSTPNKPSPAGRPPSTPSSMRSRSEPPVCSRSTPGRAAALFGQLLHSPLVRVRGARAVCPEAFRRSFDTSQRDSPSRSARNSDLASLSVPETVRLPRDASLAASLTRSMSTRARLSRKSSVNRTGDATNEHVESAASVGRSTRSKRRSTGSEISPTQRATSSTGTLVDTGAEEMDDESVVGNTRSPTRRGRSRTRKIRQVDVESSSIASSASPTTTSRCRTRTRSSTSHPRGTATRSRGISKTSVADPKEGHADLDEEESSRSSGSGRRRHVNSPLVRRSIRNRRGRHVSQRNELCEPSVIDLRSATRSRKRERTSPVISKFRKPESSPKSEDGKGKLSREVMSLLLGDRPRKRRKVNSAGSRRSVLQN